MSLYPRLLMLLLLVCTTSSEIYSSTANAEQSMKAAYTMVNDLKEYLSNEEDRLARIER